MGQRGEKGDSGAIGERGPQGEIGELPLVQDFVEGEAYLKSVVVIHDGGTYQARRNTGRKPPHDDWAPLAVRGSDGMNGKDGKDGRTMRIRGTYDPKKAYEELDVVALNGSWFVARKNEPGPCPGDGWQVGPRGRRGETGERGPQGLKGEPGSPGREVIEWVVNYKDFTVTPVMSDGMPGTTMSFYKLFEAMRDAVDN